jgi:hypothetical protein
MTLEQAVAVIEGLAADAKGNAALYRNRGDEYKQAADAAEDADLRRLQFNQSSDMYAYARVFERNAEALATVLEQCKAVR